MWKIVIMTCVMFNHSPSDVYSWDCGFFDLHHDVFSTQAECEDKIKSYRPEKPFLNCKKVEK